MGALTEAQTEEHDPHNGVTRDRDYKKIKIKCLLSEGVKLSPVGCRHASSDPLNNRLCRDLECPSIWRACKACINAGSVGRQVGKINKGTGYCAKHGDLHIERADLRRKSSDEDDTDL